MVKDAELHAESDRKRTEMVESKNAAHSLVATTKRALDEHGSKIAKEEVDAINTALEELNKVLEGEDMELIKTKTENLTKASMKLGEAMYKVEEQKAQDEASTNSQNHAHKKDDGEDDRVIDADFEKK